MAKWRELAAAHGVSVEAVAVAWAALPRMVGKVVMGMKAEEEVVQNLAAAAESAKVPAEIWTEAKSMGLVDSRIPVPAE